MLSAAEQSILSGNKEKVKLNPFYFEKPYCSGEALSLGKADCFGDFCMIEPLYSNDNFFSFESEINGLGGGILHDGETQDDYLTLNIEVVMTLKLN